MDVAAAVLMAVAVLTVPGVPLALALRLRGAALVGFLAPLSLTIVTIAAEGGRALDIPWTPLSPLVLGLLLGAVVELTHRVRGRTPSAPSQRAADGMPAAAPTDSADGPATSGHGVLSMLRTRPGITAVAGVAVGGAVLVVQQLRLMGSIRAVSQTYDAVFHLNAVRHVLRAQDASAWVVGSMTAMPGHSAYYPALWHQAASLVVMSSGADIPLASNALMLALGVLVYPIGLVMIVRTCATAGPIGVFLAGALAPITGAFPLIMMSWGILWPYLMSIALVPVAICVCAQLLRLAPAGPRRLTPGQLAVAFPLVGLTIVAAHPTGFYAAMLLCGPMLAWASVLRARRLVGREPGALLPFAATTLLTVVAAVVTAVVWKTYRPNYESAVWAGDAAPREAIGQALSMSAHTSSTVMWLGVVVAASVLVLILTGAERWMVAAFTVATVHGVFARTLDVSPLRYQLTGGWYGDTFRITAIAPLIGVPLLAVAIDHALQWAASRQQRLASLTHPLTAAVIAALMLTGSTTSTAQAQVTSGMEPLWQHQQLLSDDELRLLQLLPQYVPEDAVIATNAWNGSSLAYAISDRTVLNTFMGFQAEPEVHLLNARLDEANTVPEVCDAADELDVDYALDFGPEELLDRRATYTGLNEISSTGAAVEVLRVGEASLWKLKPCLGTDGTMLE